MAAKTLSDSEVKKIADAHGKGEPLPEGVTFAPYNKPPYIATDEYFAKHRELDGGSGPRGASGPVENATPTS